MTLHAIKIFAKKILFPSCFRLKIRSAPCLTLRLFIFSLLLLYSPLPGFAIDLTGSPVSATPNQACIGTRAGTNLGCTAKEFTVSTTFSAAPGTPPICTMGSTFDFLVDVRLSGSNANRYDISFYTGEDNNSPQISDSTKSCSAVAFPMSLASIPGSPWADLDSGLNQCADYVTGGDSTVRINRIYTTCIPDANGYLAVPYTLAYEQNTGNPTCVAGTPSTYPIPTKSKCQSGTSSVSGTVKVFSGAYVDVTKQTLPDGDTQSFSFTASGPSGSSVFATTPDGVFHPSTATPGVNSIPVSPDTITIKDGETVRFLVNALAGPQTLTISEAATTNWETTASISCTNTAGTPISDLDGNPANRTITANLSATNSAAACTITNTKRSRITLVKSVNGRADAADQFTVSASGGGTLTGTTSATTSGSGTSASTAFYSSPNTPLTLTDAKAAGPTPLSGYFTNLTCTNAFAGSGATPNSSLPSGTLTSSYTFSPAPGDDITCTYTNTRKVSFTLQKTWANAIVNDAVNVTASGLTTLSTTANTASETDAGAVQSVRVGDVITLGESFTSGAASNYTAALACSGTSGLSGATVTVGSTDTAIVCTYTNTRKTATFTLQKTWVNAIVNDAVNVTASGLTTLSSTANTSSETDTGGSQTIRAGDVITLGETFTSGSPFNYSVSLACTGTSGLAGNTLAVGSVDTDIVCTYTNTFGGLPLLSILKSAIPVSANPGQTITYTVQIANSGTGSGTNVVLTDSLSPYSAFGVNSYGIGIPFTFTDAVSGLSLGTPQYSSNNGSTWTYVPVSGGGGAQSGYDANVTNWRIPMTGSIVPGGSFTLNYQVIVK